MPTNRPDRRDAADGGDADPSGEEVLVDVWPRCLRCGRLLAHYIGRPWSVRCRRSAPTVGARRTKEDTP